MYFPHSLWLTFLYFPDSLSIAHLSSFSQVAERLGLLRLLRRPKLEGHQGLLVCSRTYPHSSPSENASAFSVALLFMESASTFHRQWPFLSASPFRWHFSHFQNRFPSGSHDSAIALLIMFYLLLDNMFKWDRQEVCSLKAARLHAPKVRCAVTTTSGCNVSCWCTLPWTPEH